MGGREQGEGVVAPLPAPRTHFYLVKVRGALLYITCFGGEREGGGAALPRRVERHRILIDGQRASRGGHVVLGQ